MLSVVIPTYNGRRFVGEALASVFAQTKLPDEVIVVDDASTDGTPELVEAMIETVPIPLRVIRLPTNSGGPARPLNVGIEAAAGDLIAVLDQDDVFTPTKLHDQARVLIEDPSIVYAFSLPGVNASHGDTLETSLVYRDLIADAEARADYFRLSEARVLFLLMKHGTFVVGYPAFVFRRRDWNEEGRLDETLRVASDYDVLCRLSKRGPVAFVPKSVYVRRQHGSNLSGDLRSASLEVSIVLLRCFDQAKIAGSLQGRSEELRGPLLNAGYWFRKVGRYRDAARAYELAVRCAGLDWGIARDAGKLLVQQLRRLLSWGR